MDLRAVSSNHILLGAIADLYWYGRRRSGKEAMLGFALQRALSNTVKAKEKEIIAERVMRNGTDHETAWRSPGGNLAIRCAPAVLE